MIRFACPGCEKTFVVADEKAGKVSKCPKCGAAFTIPAPYSPPSPPPPPPAVPPAPAANDAIEIRPCPKCQSRLSVMAADIGSEIECPSCRTVYRATRADAPPPPGADSPGPVAPSSKLVKLGSGRPDDGEDEDEKPRRRKRRRYVEEDNDEDDYEPPAVARKRRPARSKGWRTVNALGVLSCGRVMGITYAIIGLLYAMIAGAFLLLGAGFASRVGGTEVAVGLFSWSVCLLILTPLIWGVVGFVGGVIAAFLYNVVAGWVGGIEIELE